MIVKKLAISPISPISASSEAPVPSPKTALNPSNNGVADVPIVRGSAADAGVQEQGQDGEQHQRRRAPRSSRGECPASDRETPRRPAAVPRSRGRTRSRTVGRGRFPAMPFGRKLLPPSSGGMLVSRLASKDRLTSTATKKNARIAERQHRDHHGEPHGDLDAEDVDPDEDDVVDRPPQHRAVPPPVGSGQVEDDVMGEEAHRAHDDRGGDDVLHVLGQPGDEAAPWAHRRSGERVGAAGVRQGRRHLRDGEAEAVIHDRDDDPGDQQTAEAACVQAEVPAVEVARDDRSDTECPERPEGGVTAQLPLLEIALRRPLGR